MVTPATTCNSRFAGGFPRLAGIFAGKTRKNSLGTPTSGSHNSLVWTLIRANFISLEIRHRELSDDMLHDLFWILEDHQNHPKKSGQKTTRARKSRRIQRGAAWRIRSPRGEWYGPPGIITCCAAWCHAKRATPPIKETHPPPLASSAILLGL